MTQEIVVIIEPPPEVDVELTNSTAAVEVVLSETGLVGPPGPRGEPGDDSVIPGPEGPPGTVVGGISPEVFESHLLDETPHPVYDDGPSFMLLYENAKV